MVVSRLQPFGTSASGDLLIGADEIWSATQKALLPEAPKPVYTGLFNTGGFSRISGELAREARGSLNLTFGPHGFVGYSPVSCSDPTLFLWSTTVERTLDSEAAKESTLAARCWHQPIAELVANSSSLLEGPIYDLANLPTWHRGRGVLIGDAAHAMSPHAGQGASMALEDALCLSSGLATDTYENAFVQFERMRRPRVAKLAAQARRSGDNKRELSPWACRIRDGVMFHRRAPVS